MKNLSEMFEFLNNCGNEMILTEIKNHGQRLIRNHGAESTNKFKLDIEKVNTLLRLSERYLMEEFNKEKEDEKTKGNEIMTVEETTHYLKTITQTIYTGSKMQQGLHKDADLTTNVKGLYYQDGKLLHG